jgi:hypothetical protein
MRLYEMTTQVYLSLLENELNSIFIDTLKALYCDYLIDNSSIYFMEVTMQEKGWSED